MKIFYRDVQSEELLEALEAMQGKPQIVPTDRNEGIGKTGTLHADYATILATLGFEPNIEDDAEKVKASWGFEDDTTGRRAFIWCWKVAMPEDCKEWSTGGDQTLIDELFHN